MTEFVYLQKQWRILRWTREEETRIKENNGTTLKCIILDMTAVSAIDTSGLEAVFALRRRLEKQSLQLALVNPVGTDGKATQVQDQKPMQSIDLLYRNFLASLLE